MYTHTSDTSAAGVLRARTDGFGFVLLKEEEHHQGEDEEGDEAGHAARHDPEHRHLHTRLQEFWEKHRTNVLQSVTAHNNIHLKQNSVSLLTLPY